MEEEYKLEIISYSSFMPWYRVGKVSIEDINKEYEDYHDYKIEQIKNEVRWQRKVIKEQSKCDHWFERTKHENGYMGICKHCGLNQWDIVIENTWRHSFKDIE